MIPARRYDCASLTALCTTGPRQTGSFYLLTRPKIARWRNVANTLARASRRDSSSGVPTAASPHYLVHSTIVFTPPPCSGKFVTNTPSPRCHPSCKGFRPRSPPWLQVPLQLPVQGHLSVSRSLPKFAAIFIDGACDFVTIAHTWLVLASSLKQSYCQALARLDGRFLGVPLFSLFRNEKGTTQK